jgi:predicted flap endonuclease-1-like 5' DNA nuclease
VNGLTLLAMIALAIGIVIAYRAGTARGRREAQARGAHPLSASAFAPAAADASTAPAAAGTVSRPPSSEAEQSTSASSASAPAAAAAGADVERARLVRAYESEIAAHSRARANDEAERYQLAQFADDRRRLLDQIAASKAESARYRQLLVDLENNAPSLFLGGPGSLDDLKLIVGVGPVLERMLHQLGVTTYRQIAHWTEYDIDEFDRRLPEFPGRIRRDAWVTQARELHHSKYGTAP